MVPNSGSVATPEAPGPPKFMMSEPIRLLGLLALARMSASLIVSPSGFA